MKNKTLTILSVLAVVALLIGGLALIDTQPDDARQATQGVGGGPEDEQVLSDVIDNPDQYLGQSVSVQGEIDRVISPQVFVLDQMGTVIGDEILVIARNAIPEQSEDAINNPFEDGEQVTVTGTVKRMILTEIEREFDIDFDPEFEVEYEQRPIIDATEVTITGSE